MNPTLFVSDLKSFGAEISKHKGNNSLMNTFFKYKFWENNFILLRFFLIMNKMQVTPILEYELNQSH